MNELLPRRYSEVVHRLAAGIEPRDAVGGSRAGAAARVSLEYPAALPGARPLAHAAGRWSIRYVPSLPDHVDVRIEDPTRRFVARRLRLPIVDMQALRDAEAVAGSVPAANRTWRPALFPGAAYRASPSTTGVRGLAIHAGAPARWARVEARVPNRDVQWRAHSDDRGEFLLLIGPDRHGPVELAEVLTITIDIFAADPATIKAAPTTTDPLWDLPLESVAPPGPDDPVCRGVTLPLGFSVAGPHMSTVLDLTPGRITSDHAAFTLH